ncbi:hypothetical protein ES703_26660 [subsurface metagenome]
MQGAFDAGSVVAAEDANAGNDILEFLRAHLLAAEHHLTTGITRLRQTPQVQDHLKKLAAILPLHQGLSDMGRQPLHQGIQIIGNSLKHHLSLHLRWHKSWLPHSKSQLLHQGVILRYFLELQRGQKAPQLPLKAGNNAE